VRLLEQYQWLANFGFAAVVAGYVLMRIEPSIKELTKTVSVLTIVVAKLGDVGIAEVKKISGVG
jgi:hypothetical protein